MHTVGAAAFGDGSDMDKVLTFGGAMAGGFLGGKGGRWFERNYTVEPNGLGMNGGGTRIARRRQRTGRSRSPTRLKRSGRPSRAPCL